VGEEEDNMVASKFMDHREKKIIKKNLGYPFISILKQWKTRASLIRKIRSQIAGIIESSTGPHCEFCGVNYYLRAELVSNIEDIFIKFLKDDPSQNTVIWSIEKWQEVFSKHALIRTLCFNCFTNMLDRHIDASVQETQNKRFNERRRKTRTIPTSSASMSMDRNSKKLSWNLNTDSNVMREETEQASRSEIKDLNRLDTNESRVIENEKDLMREYKELKEEKKFWDYRKETKHENSRDLKIEARVRMLENEHVRKFLKGWLDMTRADVKSAGPATFR